MTDTSIQPDVDDPKIAVLLSGSGRTLENLIDRIATGGLHARIVRVISTRTRVRGVEVAERSGLPLTIVPRREFGSVSAFSDAVFACLNRDRPDLVVCAGFLSKMHIPDDWMGRIINIHPSLLPLFGGQGFYGDNVHRAVLESGMKVSGCTVHFLDNEYDAGPIIAQRCVPVVPDDSVESLAARVFAEECRLYPDVISKILRGQVELLGRVVRVIDEPATEPGTP